MASKKMSRMLKDDHDDAHFSDNPAVRKGRRKAGGQKRKGGVHKSGMSTIGGKARKSSKR